VVIRSVACVTLTWIVCGGVIAGEPTSGNLIPKSPAVRAAVERALPFVAGGGIEWIEQRECISCHRVGFMVWSQALAASRGFDIDHARLKEWTDWSVDSLLEPEEMRPGKLVAHGNVEGLAQMIFSVAPEYRAARVETYARLLDILGSQQADDGTWKPGGQLPGQKRPKSETGEVSTMWIALALGQISESDDSAGIRNRAVSAVKPASDAISAEWYAVRMLLANQSGDTAEIVRCQDHLVASQHTDGGWGWILADPSDALATGQALYALAESGLDPQHPSIQSALNFLIDSQTNDGSWPVNGTKTKDKDDVMETATYWGTAWAVIGMCRCLPEQ